MTVSKTHLFRQGPLLKTLLNTAVSSITYKKSDGDGPKVPMPGPVLEETVKPRNPKMVADFIRHIGGQPSSYKGILPPHFFPQWGMPLLAKTLDGQPYNMSRILNGGCSFEILHPIPMGKSLHLKAQLIEVDDNGYRAIFKQKLTTGTDENPESLICYVNAILPIKKSDGPKKEKPAVPVTARELDTWKLGKNSGIDFAMATGDFNPVHWISGYARMSGFKNTILHGFATMARSVESMNKSLWLGRTDKLAFFEARFVKPLVFPGTAKVFLDEENQVYVGDAPGGPAYLTGNFTAR